MCWFFSCKREQWERIALTLLVLLAVVAGVTSRGAAASLVDEDGLNLEFTKPFRRIISLYPAHTENLLALGLDQELIGVAAGDKLPPAAQRQVFSATDNPEKFLAARPDLILVRPMISQAHSGLMAQLRAAGITVVSLQPTGIEGLFAYWQALGTLTGREEQAAVMRSRFEAELALLLAERDRVPKEQWPRVYFESIHGKMKTFAPSSMAIFVLESAGGVNVAADATARNNTNIAAYGKERILARAAEIDVFLAQEGQMNPVTKEMIGAEPGFQAIKAVAAGRVCLVDEELVSRPTMALLDGIRQVRGLLYPAVVPVR